VTRTGPSLVRRIEPCWGTVIGVHVDDAVDPRAVDDVFRWFRRVDDLFSTWRDDTEISRIGRGELEIADAAPEVQEVLVACEQIRRETRGAFDITIGGRAEVEPRRLAPIDPSGFVKGWALERAVEMLGAVGVSRCSLNAGGDVVVRGRIDDQPWRIGIQHPWERDKVAEVLEVGSGAVATSGRTERGDHVIDPRTRRPATGLVSVTVVGPDLGTADALATAAVACGSIAEPWLARRPGVAAFAITDDGAVLVTAGLERYRAAA